MDTVWVVMTTFGDKEEASRVTKALVAEELIACANLLPGATSIYRWKGKICEESEVVALLKTTANNLAELQRVLAEKHSYEEPEILAFEVSGGSVGYLDFVRNATKSASLSK